MMRKARAAGFREPAASEPQEDKTQNPRKRRDNKDERETTSPLGEQKTMDKQTTEMTETAAPSKGFFATTKKVATHPVTTHVVVAAAGVALGIVGTVYVQRRAAAKAAAACDVAPA